MDGYDPYNYFMSSTADPSNYYAQGGFSTWQNQMVGPDPQASYNNPDPFNPPSGEATAFRRSPSQVPGTSGAPSETPSATPGGVSSGVGTGVPNAYPSLANIFGGLSGGQGGNQSNQLKSGLTMAQIGMRMMNPPMQQQQQDPQVMQQARMWGVDYNTALKMIQMMQQQGGTRALQFGGPVAPGENVLVGEQGPEMFRPAVPGSIVPMQQQNPLMQTMGMGANLQRRRFGMPPMQGYR